MNLATQLSKKSDAFFADEYPPSPGVNKLIGSEKIITFNRIPRVGIHGPRKLMAPEVREVSGPFRYPVSARIRVGWWIFAHWVDADISGGEWIARAALAEVRR